MRDIPIIVYSKDFSDIATIKNAPVGAFRKEEQDFQSFWCSSSVLSNSNNSPDTMNLMCSQLFVTRSTARSRVWIQSWGGIGIFSSWWWKWRGRGNNDIQTLHKLPRE